MFFDGVYRGWWNWYHGWPVGGAAVRCCFQEKERTTSSRYSHTSKTVNLDKTCIRFHVSCVTCFTDFSLLPQIYKTHLFYLTFHSVSNLLSTQQQICLCSFAFVPSVALLTGWVVVIFFHHGYRGKASAIRGWHNNKRRGRVPRVGVDSRIL